MSIVDSNVVDMIGIPSDDLSLVVMGISDHLAWGEDSRGIYFCKRRSIAICGLSRAVKYIILFRRRREGARD